MASALCEKRFRINVVSASFPAQLCFDAAFDAWTNDPNGPFGGLPCIGPPLTVTIPAPIPTYGRFTCFNMDLNPVAVGPDYGWLLNVFFGNCMGTQWRRVDPGPPPGALPWILPQGTYSLLVNACGYPAPTPVSLTLSAC